MVCTGNGHHAPVLSSLDIRGPNDLVARAGEVLAGVGKAELESILAALTCTAPVVVSGRRDHPTLVQHGGKASLTLALAAAQPNQRKRSLEDLDRDVLARSTKPANDSRLRTFVRLCSSLHPHRLLSQFEHETGNHRTSQRHDDEIVRN